MNADDRRRVRLAILKRNWQQCQRCGLSETRRNVVFGVGVSPCDLLLIGEAPNKTEDFYGKPFIGQSGNLLQTALEQTCEILKRPLPRMYLTSVCGCRPCNTRAAKTRKPAQDELLACWPRLRAIIVTVQPKRIVLLGRVAGDQLATTLPEAFHLIGPDLLVRHGGQSSRQWTPWLNGWKKVMRSL